jgi:GPCR-chaperone
LLIHALLYGLKVFCASNVQLVTKTRTEHLTEQDKKRTKKVNRTPLESFLGVAEEEEKLTGATANGVSLAIHNIFPFQKVYVLISLYYYCDVC